MNTPEQERAWEDRRRAILAHFKQSGSLTVTGLAFGVSRQRVHQIVSAANTETESAEVAAQDANANIGILGH